MPPICDKSCRPYLTNPDPTHIWQNPTHIWQIPKNQLVIGGEFVKYGLLSPEVLWFPTSRIWMVFVIGGGVCHIWVRFVTCGGYLSHMGGICHRWGVCQIWAPIPWGTVICHVANPLWYNYICLVRGTPYTISNVRNHFWYGFMSWTKIGHQRLPFSCLSLAENFTSW